MCVDVCVCVLVERGLFWLFGLCAFRARTSLISLAKLTLTSATRGVRVLFTSAVDVITQCIYIYILRELVGFITSLLYCSMLSCYVVVLYYLPWC